MRREAERKEQNSKHGEKHGERLVGRVRVRVGEAVVRELVGKVLFAADVGRKLAQDEEVVGHPLVDVPAVSPRHRHVHPRKFPAPIDRGSSSVIAVGRFHFGVIRQMPVVLILRVAVVVRCFCRFTSAAHTAATKHPGRHPPIL